MTKPILKHTNLQMNRAPGIAGAYWTPFCRLFSANGTTWPIPDASSTPPLFQRTPRLGAACRTNTATFHGTTSCGPISLCRTVQRQMKQQYGTRLVILESSVLSPSFYKIREKLYFCQNKKLTFYKELKMPFYFPNRSSSFSKMATIPSFR